MINFPILSLHILSFDPLNSRNLITSGSFENHIDIHFKIEKPIEKQYKMQTVHFPRKKCTNLEFDISILVYRIDMNNIGNLYVTLSDLTHDLRVSYSYELNLYLK